MMKRIKRTLAAVLACVFCLAGLNVGAAEANVDGTQISVDLEKNFQVLNVDAIANKITVSGIAGYAERAIVGFYMTQDSEVIFVKQVATDVDGTFEAELVLDPQSYDAEGTATLIVGATNANSQKIEGIELYSQTELETCVDDFVNGITSADDLADFLDAYGDMLAIENEYTEDEIQVLYGEYVNNLPEDVNDCDAVIAAISNLTAVVDRYKEFFEELNTAAANGDSTGVRRIITVTYKDMISFETELPMIQNENGVYAKMVEAYTEEYKSFDDIEAAFNQAILDQRDEEAVNGYVTEHKSKHFIDEEWKISVVANYLTISGKTDDAGAHNIVFYVSDYNVTGGNVLGYFQTKSAGDGSFTAKFALDPTVYGDETMGFVRVSGTDRNVYQFIIPLYGEELLDVMGDDFKDIESEEDMKAFIDTYGEMLKVGVGYDGNKIKLLTELHGAKDYSDLTYPEEIAGEVLALDETMYEVKDFIDSFNKFSKNKQHGHMREAIEVKNGELAEKSSLFAELRKTALASKVSAKGVYMRMAGQTFECIQDIIDSYDEAYEAQKDFEAEENNKKPSGGGSSFGGGGGGTSSKVEFSPDLITPPETEKLDPEKAPVEGFKDLDGYDWAKEAINGLRNLSIVRGDGKGNYRPGDAVTREEFLSMLLATFYIESENGTTPFTDVLDGQWYSDIVATAYALGITNGKGDGSFGIGESIIRADMVALAARLADAEDITIQKNLEAKIFTDYTQIPQYAYADVVGFQQAGLIQGDETGSFNPHKNLTRAEAAVFFWNIFNYIESQI